MQFQINVISKDENEKKYIFNFKKEGQKMTTCVNPSKSIRPAT